ncbi:hypothetical protein JNUCC1_02684 [Lentibacillus sp. JNUCC-1]|uniref:DUF5700 domain-containing putative Zn-dependent protease n=1 Tax=Lentibacillus sp. JNUCC-1 TaxID=2654513 RepID=UPI0012E8298B|nr:DUF5700 domain-containing putative Zn-dependent protease [Lentibacillus sp. JNUCC-1]MUV38813.1 hypothetical protein [Lentibacillus sp. JNUCC-1]
MEIINLAEKQMNGGTDCNVLSGPFFREYFRSFNSNANFEQDTTQLMRLYTLQDVSETISFLESMAEEVLYRINDVLNRDADFDIIVFFGDCSYDGHGILIDKQPYVFFDLNAIIPRLDFYNFNAFITHEMLHALHYSLNPDFYRGNFRAVEERYLKLLLSEGIATHLSYVISEEKIEDTYWFGYLKSEHVWDWVKNCETMKADTGADLHRAIDAGKLDNTLYNRLFGIEDFTKLTSYRTGYYYGAEIVKDFLADREDVNEVLTLDYSKAKDIIHDYF